MSVENSNVLTGAPDQLTTGPILSGPLGTALPTDALDTIDPLFVDSGYISQDGMNLTPERTTETIRDWSGAIIRSILNEFGASIAWAHLETNEASLKNYFGDDNVTVTAAGLTNGKQLAAQLKAAELPRKSWVFKIKDGENRVLIVVPDGQVTDTGEVSFTKAGAITWPCTMTTYPDSSGVHVYVYTDDGVFTA
ncbi:major tail protein [Arthrobacter phage Kuleana]|uniref:Major tail protein n=1 Tax=Arthrobacter phage Kuleana TaxID=2653270 RepID=A0A5Q2WE24_9CAUD|nr:major tail protein [Arthrobacter phage Kuleana]QGH74500.1 major tail protein [Arthrobacter phage Kuleana]